MLAYPWTFTAECLGSQRGLPMSTSPRSPRCCDVRGTTTTSARASRGCGKARTNTGRCFATWPKSTIHTSPGMASILTECILPQFPLLAGCQESFRKSRDRKRHVVSQFDLSQKNIEGIARLHPEPGKNLFGPLQAIRWNTCTKEGGRSHASKMLKNAHESIFSAVHTKQNQPHHPPCHQRCSRLDGGGSVTEDPVAARSFLGND